MSFFCFALLCFRGSLSLSRAVLFRIRERDKGESSSNRLVSFLSLLGREAWVEKRKRREHPNAVFRYKVIRIRPGKKKRAFTTNAEQSPFRGRSRLPLYAHSLETTHAVINQRRHRAGGVGRRRGVSQFFSHDHTANVREAHSAMDCAKPRHRRLLACLLVYGAKGSPSRFSTAVGGTKLG